MLDEPLSALDGPTREALRGELRNLLSSLNIPVLLVTHDRMEALALGDQVAIVHEGRIVQHAAIEEVFRRPLTPAIAKIVAVETVQRGRVLQVDEELVTVAVGETRLIAASSDFPKAVTEVFVCIRAENVLLLKGVEAVSASARNQLPGTVKALIREGPIWRIELDCGFSLTAVLTGQACEELALTRERPSSGDDQGHECSPDSALYLKSPFMEHDKTQGSRYDGCYKNCNMDRHSRLFFQFINPPAM